MPISIPTTTTYPMTRADFYQSYIAPFQAKKQELAFREAERQAKSQDDKIALRNQLVGSIDQQINQALAMRAAYEQARNSARDDAEKQSIDNQFQEQMNRFTAGVNIAIANAQTGRAYTVAEIEAGARLGAANAKAGNDVVKQQIQANAQAEASGPLKNQLQQTDSLFQNILSGQDNNDTYSVLGSQIKTLAFDSAANQQPVPVYSLIKSTAQIADPARQMAAAKTIAANLPPEAQAAFEHGLAAHMGGAGVASMQSLVTNPTAGYASSKMVNGALPAATGGEAANAKARQVGIDQTQAPGINETADIVNALQSQKASLINQNLAETPLNETELARQYMGSMFSARPITRRPTAQPRLPEEGQVSVPYELGKLVPEQPAADHGVTVHTPTHSVHVRAKSQEPTRPPESPAPGPTVPNPQYQQPPTPFKEYGPFRPEPSSSFRFTPGTKTGDLYPGVSNGQPTLDALESVFRAMGLGGSQEPSPASGASAAPSQSPAPEPTSVAPAASESPASPRHDDPYTQPTSKPAPIELPRADQRTSVSPTKAKQPELHPTAKAALVDAHDLSKKPAKAERLLTTDPVSKLAAATYSINRRNSKPFSDTVKTLMAAYSNKPTDLQRALSIAFYLSHKDQSTTSMAGMS